MDEPRYQNLADEAFRKLESMFADVDADDVDVERAGDVITLTFRDGKKCVVNTQRPTRQIWLAANARAWHFGYDANKSAWVDSKDSSSELFATLERIVNEGSGTKLAF